MALKFGTSGLRGLVSEMTDRECYRFARAFARYLRSEAASAQVALGGDLRSSTPRIARSVKQGLLDEGVETVFCGWIPTPALCHFGMRRSMASIMVTGSHIPDDRNGIKFNLPQGEILKRDEKGILEEYELLSASDPEATPEFDSTGAFQNQVPELGEPLLEASRDYARRYLDFFPSGSLDGRRVLLYEHSSVARDLLGEVLEGLGAEVVRCGRSETFVAVDTEAVENLDQLREWVRRESADALVSTDGDGDRPLVVGDDGDFVRGDVLGILVAKALEADAVVIPVSCNTAIEGLSFYRELSRTRIGSPYVIAGMEAAAAKGFKTVVGYEANGGFLLGSDLERSGSGRTLEALPTRDALLPILTLLHEAFKKGSIRSLVAGLPPRFTVSGVLRKFPLELGHQIIRAIEGGGEDVVAQFFEEPFGRVLGIDFTDGARMSFQGGLIVHLRPSGNAPEFRCYTEAASRDEAVEANRQALEIVRHRVAPAVAG